MTEGEMWAASPAPSAPTTAPTTCTDCGGPLEPGRRYRCHDCTDAWWRRLDEDTGVWWRQLGDEVRGAWVARHRPDDADR